MADYELPLIIVAMILLAVLGGYVFWRTSDEYKIRAKKIALGGLTRMHVNIALSESSCSRSDLSFLLISFVFCAHRISCSAVVVHPLTHLWYLHWTYSAQAMGERTPRIPNTRLRSSGSKYAFTDSTSIHLLLLSKSVQSWLCERTCMMCCVSIHARCAV